MNDRMREMLQPAPLAEMDDVPRSVIADDALTSSLIASWLTYAQRAGWSTNDELGVALAGAMAREGWRLQRTAFPATVPVQQDEPEGVPPDVAPLPRPRPPRSHRDDESLRRWEARHPSVRFRPAVPLEQECEHVWRSSFGDTFCEKCNQDAPVEIASERCRTCKGSGTWADEGWSKPPQPCKACSGSGLAPIRKRKPTVPVQQDEPECER